jgi:hypothetical protein
MPVFVFDTIFFLAYSLAILALVALAQEGR